jgi:hypothetical protein
VKYEDVDASMAVFGDPEHCVKRIREIQEEFHPDHFLAYFNQGGLIEPAIVRRSMELFAEEVMPHCR